MAERDLVRALLVYSSKLGAKLFRNSRGIERIARKNCAECQRFGRVVSYGLANGAPDLVGWAPVTVTPAMVGTTIAVFVGIEAKTDVGVVSEEQRAFLAALERDGATCGVARSVADLDELLRKP